MQKIWERNEKILWRRVQIHAIINTNMRGENNRQIENLCDNLPYLFRIGKAKDKRSLLRCRFNYVSSSLLETWRLQVVE